MGALLGYSNVVAVVAVVVAADGGDDDVADYDDAVVGVGIGADDRFRCCYCLSDYCY